MTRILIVEDEEKIARFVELELSHEGYETEKRFNGRDGLEAALTGAFDLVILDIMLPGLSGTEVLRRLRKESAVPVILLTARDSVSDKVAGLDMGANDYITKPFQIEELLARIRAVLRTQVQGKGDAGEDNKILTCFNNRVSIDVDSREVLFDGNSVTLTNREFVLLQILMENRGVAMSREKLISLAWGYDYYGETNIVDVYVRYLRHKLDNEVIQTVRGVGYIIPEK